MKAEPIEILLVEDNADHVELILDSLKNNSILNTVHVVKDGAEALDFLHQRPPFQDTPRPGLILLDIKLPKIDGIRVLKHIKNDPELRIIPVVMLTTSGTEEDIQASYNNGANSYIVKPVNYEKFTEVIKTLKMYWLISSKLPV